jgi:glutathione S-transferase
LIRLYRAPWSTNVERVALALAHKGLEVESVVIDYSDRSPVERVSGQPLVPVIDADGEVVADSSRILRWLEERHPDPPLFPADPARRAEMGVFIEWFTFSTEHQSVERRPRLAAWIERVDARPRAY